MPTNYGCLCEICLLENKATLAVDVHHLISVSDNPDLIYDPSNLMSICKYHHGLLHSNKELRSLLTQKIIDKAKSE